VEFKKTWYESKMVWLGILTALLGILTAIVEQDWIEQYPQVVSYLGMAIGIITVILRGFTDRPLKPLFKAKQ